MYLPQTATRQAGQLGAQARGQSAPPGKSSRPAESFPKAARIFIFQNTWLTRSTSQAVLTRQSPPVCHMGDSPLVDCSPNKRQVAGHGARQRGPQLEVPWSPLTTSSARFVALRYRWRVSGLTLRRRRARARGLLHPGGPARSGGRCAPRGPPRGSPPPATHQPALS
jgi:hypothetical protein